VFSDEVYEFCHCTLDQGDILVESLIIMMQEMNFTKQKNELQVNGYSILNSLYSEDEVSQILRCLETAKLDSDSVVSTTDLFAIRQLLNSVPELATLLMNSKLRELITCLSKSNYFITKGIYFNKPKDSNWFVGYHQDLSISVTHKIELKDYVNWTFKKGQYGVQPPVHILNDTITIRIHLDDTSKNNGALKVIPKSHLNGIVRTDSKDWNVKNEYVCEVKKGGVMLMKPLTFHASGRTTNGRNRRVIHLELNKHKLSGALCWLERLEF
jgi:ectoine hydroxylase-related dioxygenase (phytanoyl-CoA dioxygenase family)